MFAPPSISFFIGFSVAFSCFVVAFRWPFRVGHSLHVLAPERSSELPPAMVLQSKQSFLTLCILYKAGCRVTL